MEKEKFKVLIVEDEVIIADCLEMELENANFESCGFYTTGEEAILVAKDQKPDIVLMDVHLAGELNGIETAKEINKERDILTIFMTGFNRNEIDIKDIKKAILLEKPVDISRLQQVIEEHF